MSPCRRCGRELWDEATPVPASPASTEFCFALVKGIDPDHVIICLERALYAREKKLNEAADALRRAGNCFDAIYSSDPRTDLRKMRDIAYADERAARSLSG